MEDYIENYTYNNCFWMKSSLLYSHSNQKFNEYLKVGEMFQKFSNSLKECYTSLSVIQKEYKDIGNDGTSRNKGIKTLIDYIGLMSEEIKSLYTEIRKIVDAVKEKKESFESKKEILDMCSNEQKNYESTLLKLEQYRNNYFESINKVIEQYLQNKIKNKDVKLKQNLLSNIEAKRKEYKNQVNVVEEKRVSYMQLQGNIFGDIEDFEKSCTNDIKKYIEDFLKAIDNLKTNITLNESNREIINSIDGQLDNQKFAKENKSLVTGPKRHLYKEYSIDLNYYMDNFDYLKKEVKGKQPKEIRKIRSQVTQYVTQFLGDIIKEEPNQIHEKILEIAKKIKENQGKIEDYQYIDNIFQRRYQQFLNWKSKNNIQFDFQKVGTEWDDRFSYMQTFVGYFNKTRVGSKALDADNYEYLSKLFIKILQLNTNADIDYSLCNLVVTLAATYYIDDPKYSSGKKFISEEVKHTEILQSQGFWIGLTKFELNQEILNQSELTDTLNENMSQEKIDNNISTKIMSVTYNLIQFIIGSDTFNKIMVDIFKFCKIKGQAKENVIMMIEQQLECETNHNLVLNKELLLSLN